MKLLDVSLDHRKATLMFILQHEGLIKLCNAKKTFLINVSIGSAL